jgi:release factor glutamine methyltransferase
VPLAHLTGIQRFMGLDLFASSDALIPRAETETLVRGALDALATVREDRTLTVVDVCTGSGNVALAIAEGDPRTRVFASDLSDRAVALAQRNALRLGLGTRVETRTGDLLQPFDEPRFVGRVDLVVANPPYISSAKVDSMPDEISKFEPRLAFDGGGLGISVLYRLLRDVPRYLAPNGWLAIEVGLGQAEAMMKRMERSNAFSTVRGVPDRAGALRAVVAQAANAP